MRQIRMLRLMWRGLETEPRSVLHGHEGGNPGHGQEPTYWATAPVLDPTGHRASGSTLVFHMGLLVVRPVTRPTAAQLDNTATIPHRILSTERLHGPDADFDSRRGAMY